MHMNNIRDAQSKPVLQKPEDPTRNRFLHTRFLKTRTRSPFTRFFQPVLQLKPPSGFYRVNTRVNPTGIYPVFYPVPDPTFLPDQNLKN